MQVTLIHPDDARTETLVPTSISTSRSRVRITAEATPGWEQDGMEIVASNHDSIRLAGRVESMYTKMRGSTPNLRVYQVAETDAEVSWP